MPRTPQQPDAFGDPNKPEAGPPNADTTQPPLPPLPPLPDAAAEAGEARHPDVERATRAVAATSFQLTDAFVAERWEEYKRSMGAIPDWRSATEVERRAFRRALEVTIAQVRRFS